MLRLASKVVGPLHPKVEEIIKSRQKWCLTYDSRAIRARHELTSICHSLIATAHIHDFQMCVKDLLVLGWCGVRCKKYIVSLQKTSITSNISVTF